eukprot:10310-Heterococcus_DN1.PRE.4
MASRSAAPDAHTCGKASTADVEDSAVVQLLQLHWCVTALGQRVLKATATALPLIFSTRLYAEHVREVWLEYAAGKEHNAVVLACLWWANIVRDTA